MVMSPGLQIKDGSDLPPGAAAPPGPATRGQITALIDHLLNLPPPSQGTADALMGAEMVMVRDTLRWYTRANWVIAPAVDAIEIQSVNIATAAAQAATRPRASSLAAAGSAASAGSRVSRGLFAEWMGPVRAIYPRLSEQDTRLLAERRMAAVSLAAQLYRVDHAGRWPRKLDELVPAYLPASPVDPFRADGGPLSYLITKNTGDGAERPLVYSVSSDGVENTQAKPAIVPPEPLYSWVSRSSAGGAESPDQWRDLSRFIPPTPPPSAQDGEDTDGDGVPDDAATQPSTQPDPDADALQP
jgi:hypothetical protein